MNPPRRGDVWLTDFGQTRGHEQSGTRPALVVSIDTFNTSKAGLVTVLPMTSKERALRSRVEVVPPEGGLTLRSYVIGEQTRTVSTERLIKPLGRVTGSTMSQSSSVVRTLLGLGEFAPNMPPGTSPG